MAPPLCAPTHAPAGSALDVLLNSQRLKVLDKAGEDLQNYCSRLPSVDERDQCWEAYTYYQDKRRNALNGCVHELQSAAASSGTANAGAAQPERGDTPSNAGSDASSCTQLDRMQQMVWEVAYGGRTEDLYRVIRAEANVARKRAAAPALPGAGDVAATAAAGGAGAGAPSCGWSAPDAQHQRAAKLFRMMDTDGNGFIDRDELAAAARALSLQLGDWDIAQALECLDSHGAISLEQFQEILDAESLRSPGSDAELLRHLRHSRPAWWSECPASIDCA